MKTKLRGKRQSIVVIFGVFDLLHKGHISLFKQAKKHGEVVAIVARDSSVLKIKNRNSHHKERTRLAAVRRIPEVSKVFLGDKVLGSYSVLKKLKPQTICLGYDQRTLETDLRVRIKKRELPSIKIIRLKPHKPHKFKTSIVARNIWKEKIQSN